MRECYLATETWEGFYSYPLCLPFPAASALPPSDGPGISFSEIQEPFKMNRLTFSFPPPSVKVSNFPILINSLIPLCLFSVFQSFVSFLSSSYCPSGPCSIFMSGRFQSEVIAKSDVPSNIFNKKSHASGFYFIFHVNSL